MPSERAYWSAPQTSFQACINAIAYLDWSIDWRDESQYTMHIKTPFTTKKFRPSFQDTIDVEVYADGDGSVVWVDSNPRFQLWNWGQDARNESTFLDEVSREIQRIGAQRQRQSSAQHQQ